MKPEIIAFIAGVVVALVLMEARRQDQEYYVDHGGDQFYHVVINDKGYRTCDAE